MEANADTYIGSVGKSQHVIINNIPENTRSMTLGLYELGIIFCIIFYMLKNIGLHEVFYVIKNLHIFTSKDQAPLLSFLSSLGLVTFILMVL